MKKISFSFLGMAALLAAGSALVACSQKNLNVVEEIPEYSYSVSVNATKGETPETDPDTRSLSLDGNVLNASWLTTENVFVKKGSTWATGSLLPQSAGATAVLKGEVTVAGSPIEAGNELFLQFPKSGDPSYSGQKGTIEDISANFDYATATVTVSDVNDETGIITTDAAAFVNQQAIVKFNLLRYDGTPVEATSLNINSSIDVTPTSASSTLYVAMPGFAEGSSLSLTANDGSRDYSFSKASFPQAVENGKYYEFNIKFKPVINVTTASPIYVVEAGANGSEISYAIANVAAGEKVSASANVAWISNIDYSTAGTVSFDVTGQATDAAPRTGTITLNYDGAASKTVTILQEGLVYTLNGSTAGGSQAFDGGTVTQNGITWTVQGDSQNTPWRIGGPKYTGNRAIYSTNPISNSYNVSRVSVSSGASTLDAVNSLTITAHDSAPNATSGGAIGTKSETNSANIISKTVTLNNTADTNPWTAKYYRFVYSVSDTKGKEEHIEFLNAKIYGYNVLP